MNKSNVKEWTILIYANGNNEMEPEMYSSMKAAEREGSNDDVNVVIELGRISRKLISAVRGENVRYNDDEKWTGTRRFYLKSEKSEFIEELGFINMADPRNLYEFIKWGTENYPAKHYMLILGGHGIFFVGMMTDFTEGIAYMMGTPEMCNAINRAAVPIDILVMDMCYMNSIELIYELGKKKNNAVKTMITYIGDGPYEGLPFDRLINIVKKAGFTEDTIDLTKFITDNLTKNLISYDINNSKLKKIKQDFNELAFLYLKNKEKWNINMGEILSSSDSSKPWHRYLQRIETDLNSIILNYDMKCSKTESLIKIMLEELHNLSLIYCKLAFAENNYWTHIVLNRDISSLINFKIKIEQKPMRMPGIDLSSYILSINPSTDRELINSFLKSI